MIDVHCHILPGIDDGPRTLELAVEMCHAAAAAGCEAIVATPHQRRGGWWNCDRQALAALRAQLQAAVGPAPRILPGGEIHVDPQLLGEILALRGGAPDDDAQGPQPLAGSRHLLIEFGATDSPVSAAHLVHELAIAGWHPVIAHPEHFPWLLKSPALADLVSLGALAQVTAMSVTGDFGSRAQSDTLRLIDRGLVHFVASDAHDMVRRPPGMAAAYKAIAARWGEATARQLMVDNPRALVASSGDSAGDGGEPCPTRLAAAPAAPAPPAAQVAAPPGRNAWRAAR
jgi:protein-tyrosine phosphatase